MDIILKYFPDLNDRQIRRIRQLEPLYRKWNQQINVISRKDIDHLYEHHILHTMSISRIISFKPGAAVLDLGTGGGFPGIPLAILFPLTHFTLIDATQKKIKVVQAITNALELENVTALHIRAEEVKRKFDFVVCRAVASLDKLVAWSFPIILTNKQQHALPNGLIALKGGAVQKEIRLLPKSSYVEVYPLTDLFEEPYFEEKYAIYVQR